jgi:hypothetical protein
VPAEAARKSEGKKSARALGEKTRAEKVRVSASDASAPNLRRAVELMIF